MRGLVREQRHLLGSSHWCRLKQGEKGQASFGLSVARLGRLAWLLGLQNRLDFMAFWTLFGLQSGSSFLS